MIALLYRSANRLVLAKGISMRRFLGVLGLCGLACVAARADVESGPKGGEAVPALPAFGVVGAVEGKEVDYAKERKELPTVYAFVQAEHWSRPMARFLKKLDATVPEADEKARVVAVWLSDKPDDAKTYLPRAQQSLNFSATSLGVYSGAKSGPNGWGINPDAHVTVVVVNRGKVAASVAFQSVNETDAPKVQDALKRATGKKK